MFPEERRTQIIAVLNHQGRCLVTDLARELQVSEVTIRQDLDLLEQEGRLRRTHGGAISLNKIGMERPFQIEETSSKSEKERIAVAALELISANDTIILDVGTTVTEVAKRMHQVDGKLTVLTNGLNIATILESNPNITTIVTGGTLRAQQHSLVNPFATLILDKIHADMAFIGVSGISSQYGVTNVNIAETEIKSLFLKAARRRVVLADASKIAKVTLTKVAEIEAIDLLITDKRADPKEVDRLREKGLEIKIV